MKAGVLSALLFAAFWPLLFTCAYIYGLAGSPQPDNWAVLSRVGDYAGLAAIACILSCVEIGIWCKLKARLVPLASKASVITILALLAYVTFMVTRH